MALSEQQMVKKALAFIKSYYKHRPRIGETETSLDMRGQGGIVTDGLLTFTKPDGTRFQAAVEASPPDRKDEVRFRLQRTLLNWDAAAVGMMLAAIGSSVSLRVQIGAANQIGFLLHATWVTALFCLVFLVYRYLGQRFRRYRYIHAVEQFKQYHTDDQWIALGGDVFSDHDDPEYVELRRQCTIQGIGLLFMEEETPPQMIMAPARDPSYMGKRRKVNLVRFRDWSKTTYQQGTTAVKAKVPGVVTPLAKFPKSYHNQMAVCAISLLLFGLSNWKAWQMRPVEYVSESRYEARVLQQVEDETPEPEYYMIDSGRMAPRHRQMEPYLNLLIEDEEAERKEGAPSMVAPPGIYLGSGPDTIRTYPCQSMPLLRSSQYVIIEGRYTHEEDLLDRMRELRPQDVEVHGLRMACLHSNLPGYILFLGNLYENKAIAQDVLQAYHQRLGSEPGLPNVKLVQLIDLIYP